MAEPTKTLFCSVQRASTAAELGLGGGKSGERVEQQSDLCDTIYQTLGRNKNSKPRSISNKTLGSTLMYGQRKQKVRETGTTHSGRV